MSYLFFNYHMSYVYVSYHIFCWSSFEDLCICVGAAFEDLCIRVEVL